MFRIGRFHQSERQNEWTIIKLYYHTIIDTDRYTHAVYGWKEKKYRTYGDSHIEYVVVHFSLLILIFIWLIKSVTTITVGCMIWYFSLMKTIDWKFYARYVII